MNFLALRSTAPRPRLARFDWIVVGGLVCGWALLALIVNPAGEFPLNDDWSYGLPVKWLVQDGHLHFTGWQSHPLITQVMWGALFALPAGFSFTALRVSTLAIASIGLGATYWVARQAGLERIPSIAVTMVLLVNPIFISLSHTFMLDVPNLSLAMASIAFLLYGLSKPRVWAQCAGWLILLLASLIRQPTLAVALGVTIAIALRDGINARWVIRVLFPSILVGACVLFVYPHVVQGTIGLPSLYYVRADSLLSLVRDLLHLHPRALLPLVRSLVYGLLNVGLWLFPALVLNIAKITPFVTPADKARTALGVCLGALIVTAALWASGKLMPLGDPGNILVDLGTGVRTIRGEAAHAPRLLWLVVTGASAAGALLVAVAIVGFARQVLRGPGLREGASAQWRNVFLLSTAVVYYAPFGLNYGAWFDRFTLPLIALLAVVIASLPAPAGARPQLGRIIAAVGIAGVYLVFGVASTHDYLAWNRARWKACGELLARDGISPSSVDCGFEFNNLAAALLPRETFETGLLNDGTRAAYAAFVGSPNGSPVVVEACRPWLPWAIKNVSIRERGTGSP